MPPVSPLPAMSHLCQVRTINTNCTLAVRHDLDVQGRLWKNTDSGRKKKKMDFFHPPPMYLLLLLPPIPHLAPWCLVSLPRLSNQRQTGLRAGRSPFIESSLLFLFCFFFLSDKAPPSSSERVATCPSVTTDHTASRRRLTAGVELLSEQSLLYRHIFPSLSPVNKWF